MGDMRMYQDTRRLDFHALGREIKRMLLVVGCIILKRFLR